MKNMKWITLIIGVLVLICGISLVFTPYDAYIMTTWFIPFALVFNGAGNVMKYFSEKKAQSVSGWLLADGIFSFILGIWLLFRPGGVMLALPYVFSFWVLTGGCLRIGGAFALKKESGKWLWLLIWGIIGVVSGLFLLYHPLLSGKIIAYLVAWTFVFIGIQSIMNSFMNKDEAAA